MLSKRRYIFLYYNTTVARTFISGKSVRSNLWISNKEENEELGQYGTTAQPSSFSSIEISYLPNYTLLYGGLTLGLWLVKHEIPNYELLNTPCLVVVNI